MSRTLDEEIGELRADLAGAMLCGSFVVRATEVTLLENEIERRGLHQSYVSALWDIAGCDGNDEGENIWRDEWKLIRATPEQKARAFLEATKEREV